MFQDFGNNMAWTGRRAHETLENIYNAWHKAQSKPQKKSRTHLKKVTQIFALNNPFIVQMLAVPPADGSTIKWEGPGNYMSASESYEVPAKALPELSKGPKWLRALEMWEQLSPTYSDRYRLFVARDNRKQAWRRSLCNPFFQAWGFKVRPAKTKKAKFAVKTSGAVPPQRGRDFITDYLDRPNVPTATGTIYGQGQTPVKAPKPKVGIWT